MITSGSFSELFSEPVCEPFPEPSIPFEVITIPSVVMLWMMRQPVTFFITQQYPSHHHRALTLRATSFTLLHFVRRRYNVNSRGQMKLKLGMSLVGEHMHDSREVNRVSYTHTAEVSHIDGRARRIDNIVWSPLNELIDQRIQERTGPKQSEHLRKQYSSDTVISSDNIATLSPLNNSALHGSFVYDLERALDSNIWGRCMERRAIPSLHPDAFVDKTVSEQQSFAEYTVKQ